MKQVGEDGLEYYCDQQPGEGSPSAKVVEVDIQGLRPTEITIS